MKVCSFSVGKAVTHFDTFLQTVIHLIITQPKSSTISVCKLRIKISLLVDGFCKINSHTVPVVCLCVKWLHRCFSICKSLKCCFSDHILGSCESHIEAGMQFVWRCVSLKSQPKYGYSEKSANIDVQFFFKFKNIIGKKVSVS